MQADCLVDGKNIIGECCFQDPRDQCVYWTDIESCRIYRLAQDKCVTTFVLPGRAAFVLPLVEKGFAVGFATQIAVADQDFQNFRRIVDVEPELGFTRINDGAVDPFGGIVFGTYDELPEPAERSACSVYRLSPTGNLRRLFGKVAVSNGIDFSPDGTTMYFADTADGTIRRFQINDPEFENFVEIANPLACRSDAPGKPDGGCVDSAGNYWSARVWGHCAVRFSADGKVNGKVDVPVKGPTCVALGGRDMKTLYVTSLRKKHTDEELATMPQAGGLFASQVDVPGITQRLCSLLL